MKFRLFASLMIALMLLAGISPVSALAGPYETEFTTTVVYQNIGTAATTTLNLLFYESPSTTTPVTIARPAVNQYGSLAVSVGSLGGLPADFQGSAVLVADQPMSAIMVQSPNSTSIMIHPISNGFKSGATQALIATVLKTATATSKFVVQNTGTTASDVRIRIFNTANPPVAVYDNTSEIQGGAAKYVDLGDAGLGLPSGFTQGSAVAESTDGGTIVAGVLELGTGTSKSARAFESMADGALTVYMPSAMCKRSGQTSYYAVQNTNLTASTQVTVRYSNGKTHTATIGPGAKASFDACAKQAANWIGSAKITSTTHKVIAVGKVEGAGMSTAFMGLPSGATKVALPFAAYGNNTHYNTTVLPRTYIAIQNIGGSAITGNVVVTFYNPDGSLAGTHTITTDIAVNGKVSTDASKATKPGGGLLTDFGCVDAGCTGVGGSAIVTGPSGSQLAVIARVVYYRSAAPALTAGEDYNAIPME